MRNGDCVCFDCFGTFDLLYDMPLIVLVGGVNILKVMKDFAKKFYKSKAWQKCRQGYISRRKSIDGGLCEVCREQLGYIVHHKIPLTPQNINDPNITLNYNNLQYDCKQCHDSEDVHAFIKKAKCKFDESGQPVCPP